MSRPPSSLPPSVQIIGHRGASADAPENTLASVKEGWKQAADAVEIDVHLTRDRHIVAVHDFTLARYGGPDVPIREMTLAQVQQHDVGRWKAPRFAGERVPTLRDVLAAIPDGRRLLVEVKCGPEIVEPLVRDLEASRTPAASCELIGFGFETMAAVRQALPERRVFLVSSPKRNTPDDPWMPDARHLLDLAARAKFAGVDLRAGEFVAPEVVRRFHDSGFDVYVWTVNTLELAVRMIEAGVSGITTDRPGWLREQLELHYQGERDNAPPR